MSASGSASLYYQIMMLGLAASSKQRSGQGFLPCNGMQTIFACTPEQVQMFVKSDLPELTQCKPC